MRILEVRRAFLVALGLAATACYQGQGGAADGEEEGTAGSDSGEGDGEGDDAAVDEFCMEETMPGRLSRFVRLTHRQYDNTVRDLLGVTDLPGSTFIADPAIDGFANNAAQLRVNDPLARDYRRAAEEIAAELVADTPRLMSIVPCDPSSATCAAEFVAEFGRRAYRRPLLAAEQAQLETIFASGADLYEAGNAFEQGVALVVESVLQSPSFLYRSELSAPEGGGDVVALDGWEIAARLSYMLWNSMPDDTLLAAAEAGELDSAAGIEEHARRMLDDERAADPIEDFHHQWLEMADYATVAKDPNLYPEFTPAMADSMEAETLAFARRVILEGEGTYEALMTSTESLVDSNLAPIYGVDDPGQPTWMTLPASERAGFLTHAGFLSANAYFVGTSPIHRGVFVQRRVLCTAIPDPPGDADLELPPADGELVTTRDRVEYHTSPDACVSCHQMINMPGYAFEGYDAIGRIRTEDNGAPVDATGLIATSEGDIEFSDAVEMINQIAVHPQAQRCYMTQWFRYASARSEVVEDVCTLDGLHQSMVEGGYDIRELLVSLTQTVSFRFRNTEGE